MDPSESAKEPKEDTSGLRKRKEQSKTTDKGGDDLPIPESTETSKPLPKTKTSSAASSTAKNPKRGKTNALGFTTISKEQYLDKIEKDRALGSKSSECLTTNVRQISPK